MFFVFNKDKINAYLISIGTVIGLFVIAFFVGSSSKVVETSSKNEVNNNEIYLQNIVK